MKIQRVETLVIVGSVGLDGDEVEGMINKTQDLTVESWEPLSPMSSQNKGFTFVVHRELDWYPDSIK